MPQFASVLDQPSADIKRPDPMPVGTYVWQVPAQYKQDKAKTGTEYVEWLVKCLGATEDVDQEALAACLKGKAITDKAMKATFYLTEDSVWRLKEFLDFCGVDDPAGATLRGRIPGAGGLQVLGTVRHEPSQDGTYMIAKLSGFAAMPS